MYDVFLSHNRINKPWVRQLYRFLTAQKLNVFFDEDSIAPGANFLTEIERGLERSKYVLLIISKASNASKWVTLETDISICDDPDAEKGRLIPIVVEKIEKKELRSMLRPLNCVDLTDSDTSESKFRRLLAVIGVNNAHSLEVSSLLSNLKVDTGSRELTVAGEKEVFEWGWNGIRLLEEFIELDYATLDKLQISHEGSPDQWAPVFMEHPATWRMLISGPQEIRGYWHFAPLFPDDYQRAKDGSLLDSEITADRIQEFAVPGDYDIYFVQICLHPHYRDLPHRLQLFRSVLETLTYLARQNVFIREICANAYTPVGHSICKSFGLTQSHKHAEHGDIYLGSIQDVLSARFGNLEPELKVLYKQAGRL